jgi:hypothetical protein
MILFSSQLIEIMTYIVSLNAICICNLWVHQMVKRSCSAHFQYTKNMKWQFLRMIVPNETQLRTLKGKPIFAQLFFNLQNKPSAIIPTLFFDVIIDSGESWNLQTSCRE